MPSDPLQRPPREDDAIWHRLTNADRLALEGFLGAGAPRMTAEVADRLQAFGLVERLLGSYALTRAGRELVLRYLGWKAP